MKITIKSIMAFVILISILLTIYVNWNASYLETGARALEFLTLAVLMFAALSSFSGDPAKRGLCVGAAFFGWFYLLLFLSHLVDSYLPTRSLLNHLAQQIDTRLKIQILSGREVYFSPSEGKLVQGAKGTLWLGQVYWPHNLQLAGHCLFSLILALLGGVIGSKTATAIASRSCSRWKCPPS